MAKITMIIDWDSETGKVEVKGPLGMKGMCNDLLDRAREIVDQFKEKGKPPESKLTPS